MLMVKDMFHSLTFVWLCVRFFHWSLVFGLFRWKKGSLNSRLKHAFLVVEIIRVPRRSKVSFRLHFGNFANRMDPQ